MGNAMAWATRGAWDSAAVELDAWTRLSTDPRDALRAYGLGALGVRLGGWTVERVEPLRRAAAEVAAAGERGDRAELAWLDGIIAYSSRDTAGLIEARSRVRASGLPDTAPLEASLEGFEHALRGDEATGARSIERTELAIAERYGIGSLATRHPYLTAVNRLHAGRWLLAAGDTAAAVRLLQWEQGIPASAEAGRIMFATFVVHPFVLAELARVAGARGRPEQAADRYRRLLRLQDLPSSPQGIALVAEAKATIAEARGRRR
jgi:hypothetical protein